VSPGLKSSADAGTVNRRLASIFITIVGKSHLLSIESILVRRDGLWYDSKPKFKFPPRARGLEPKIVVLLIPGPQGGNVT
jgi:hypothetical protein